MELTQIKYFVRLAEVLNFTEAAKALFVTQSALSISIKQLEEELNCRLFDRIGKKVYLTEAGKVFHEHAAKALMSIESGIQKINTDNKTYRGELVIGVTFSMMEILNSCIVKYTQKYPNVKLTVIMYATVEEVINSLQNNKLDIAVTYKPEKQLPSVMTLDLATTYLSAILSKRHPLAGKNFLTLAELCTFPFVTLLRGTHTRTVTDHLFDKNDIDMVPQIEVNETNLILNMVSTGHWFSILAPISVKRNSDCVAIPINGEKELLSVSLLWMSGKSKTPLLQTLIDEMLAVFEHREGGID